VSPGRALALLGALLLPPGAPAQAPIAVPPPAATAPAAPADPWAPLRPLLGEWVGEPSNREIEPVVSAAIFELQLQDSVMVRRHRAVLPTPAGETNPPVHDDLMVIWAERDAFHATYWDSEGHVIHYRVTAAAGAVTFDSEPGPGPRFRLEYRPRPDGGQAITFSVAPPGGALKPYVSGGAHRRVK
jgi:hypothetical protein